MGRLVEEVGNWNTPLIGAYLIWRFTKGFSEAHKEGEAPIGIYLFIAMGILTNKRLLEPVNNYRKNIQSYIRCFEDQKDSDILLTIGERILEKKEYTLSAIDIALKKGLIVWEATTGKIYFREIKKSKMITLGMNYTDGKKAEILGKWFSQHSLETIASYLKVVL